MMARAVELFTFLNYCEESYLPKEVLECGAGLFEGLQPLLARFHERGYHTLGIEIDETRLQTAVEAARNLGMDIDLRHGDMRALPFEDNSLSFAFSYNSIFHMRKSGVAQSVAEIQRVLRPTGLAFVNFLSVESASFGSGNEVGPGEFLEHEHGGEVIHAYYTPGEPDSLFQEFDILLRQRRVVERRWEDQLIARGYLDYIIQKPA